MVGNEDCREMIVVSRNVLWTAGYALSDHKWNEEIESPEIT
jgi:hypothetical protein